MHWETDWSVLNPEELVVRIAKVDAWFKTELVESFMISVDLSYEENI